MASLEAARPKLEVGFQDDEGVATKGLVFVLTKVTWPDYAKLVDQKRDELSGPKNRPLSMRLGSFDMVFERSNPNYAVEIEEYLENLKEYMMFLAECSQNRIRAFRPVIRNSGNISIHGLVLEIGISEGGALLSSDQEEWLYSTLEEGEPPPEPRPELPPRSRLITSTPGCSRSH